MKEILETIINSLISEDAEAIVTEVVNSDREIKLEVRVNSENMGRVIGRNGRIAKSIRTLMRAIATKENKKVVIEFVD
ncbi:MAG: KH domain-containing protein [Clostridia bacterium]|nr:KH domain-containing protein [Clostridia bacterium]